MLDRIVIRLTGLICACPYQALAWGIFVDPTRLHIECETCGRVLEVPDEQVSGSIACARPYPKGRLAKPAPSAPLLKLLKPEDG